MQGWSLHQNCQGGNHMEKSHRPHGSTCSSAVNEFAISVKKMCP